MEGGTRIFTFPKTEEEIVACLRDPQWRIRHLYKIKNKQKQIVPFKPNDAQEELLRRMWFRNVIPKARQRGFCLHPSTRVLTASLEWVPIGDIKPGARLVAVDEDVPGGKGPSRKMRTATVEATAITRGNAYRMLFDDGREVVCTGNHRWLTRPSDAVVGTKWRSIESDNKCKIRPGTLVRWVTKPWGEPSYEDGWIGGMLDGEGHMSKRNVAASINVSQVVGPALARFEMYLDTRGYNYCTEDDAATRESKQGSQPVPKLVVGRMDEMFRIIGQTRPIRFIGNEFWDGRDLPGKRSGIGWAKVASIDPLGEMDMVDLQTSAKTFIAEGFVSHNSTLIQLMGLDTALFKPGSDVGIIAQDLPTAQEIFESKIKLAYDNLPDTIKQMVPITRSTTTEMKFANGSGVRVGTSMRGGTPNFVHVSEFGKISAKYPDKAREVLTGTLPAVPIDGIVFVESTAEGRDGAFYDMSHDAKAAQDEGRKLTPLDFRLHFASWWDADEYELDPAGVIITEKDHEYFDRIESLIGQALPPRKRAWYVTTRRQLFAGDHQMMFQEFPSTFDEAFSVSMEGTYYAQQLAHARKDGRIMRLPVMPGVPCYTVWDIGNSDGTAIWVVQKIGNEWRCLRFYEAWGEPYSHAVRWLQGLGMVWDTMYLPHDADHIRQGQTVNKSPKQMLEELMPGVRFEIVPRIEDVNWGIQQTRDMFPLLWFDDEHTKPGIIHIENYRKKWNDRQACWSTVPDKTGGHSEAADALRQLAQAYAGGLINVNRGAHKRKRPSSWRTS